MYKGFYGNDYSVTMVYVDSYENKVFCGRFASPYLEKTQEFVGISDFIIKMESLLDVMALPQSSAVNVGFRKNLVAMLAPGRGIMSRGKKATFSLIIRFRQNDSWQGTINWLESNNKQNFRSVLELIVLLDSALREQNISSEQKHFVSSV